MPAPAWNIGARRLPAGVMMVAVDRLPQLRPAARGTRARPALGPSAERLEDLARAVSSGRYRVEPARVAEAILSSRRRPG